MNLQQEFDKLADEWERETRNNSSLTDIVKHPNYRAIVSLGPPAVPLILNRMRTRPGFWFGALRELTNVELIRPEMRGYLQKMTDVWLEWGIAQGHIKSLAPNC